MLFNSQNYYKNIHHDIYIPLPIYSKYNQSMYFISDDIEEYKKRRILDDK